MRKDSACDPFKTTGLAEPARLTRALIVLQDKDRGLAHDGHMFEGAPPTLDLQFCESRATLPFL